MAAIPKNWKVLLKKNNNNLGYHIATCTMFFSINKKNVKNKNKIFSMCKRKNPTSFFLKIDLASKENIHMFSSIF
jgi:hypothetical protein